MAALKPETPSSGAPRRVLALVGGLTALLLVLTADQQIFDTNFYTLWEATGLLAGDHPYRDFYEWGVPLQAAASAAAQLLVGHRLIGEFLLQWLFIVAGVVIVFQLGLDLSRSIAASLVTVLLALIILASTPTFHYPKLFFYPLAVWLAWRYIERSSAARAAVLGVATGVAFLFRHDHGVYIGGAAALAFALARLATSESRTVRSVIGHGAAYSAATALVLSPWLTVVHRSEGVAEYVRVRAALYEEWSARDSPYRSLLTMNPMRALSSDEPSGANPAGATRWRLPSRDNAVMWLQQVALLIPILLLLTAALDVARSWRRAASVSVDTCRIILAAVFLAVIDGRVFREPSYVVVVAPLTAAMSARLLAGNRRQPWSVIHAAIAGAMLLVTSITAISFTGDTGIFEPLELVRTIRPAFEQMVATPPIDGYVPADALRRHDRATWHSSDANDNLRIRMRYVHDCTEPGDRILVTGSTPYQVSYYAHRPIAGGHLFWRHRWRSDPEHEGQSLALLRNQSVPFAFSTDEPVLEDFKAYPRIREYLLKHYAEPQGADGLLLVDTRRQPRRLFEPTGWPCFR